MPLVKKKPGPKPKVKPQSQPDELSPLKVGFDGDDLSFLDAPDAIFVASPPPSRYELEAEFVEAVGSDGVGTLGRRLEMINSALALRAAAGWRMAHIEAERGCKVRLEEGGEIKVKNGFLVFWERGVPCGN